MQMNLNDFETQVNPIILDRGIDYYENGYVSNLQKFSTGEWVAQVEGNYGNYHVKISLTKDNNIVHHHCNCPFEGVVCKHLIAVLFAIKEEQSKPESETGINAPEWESIIKNTPEQELRNFLLDFAKTNQAIQHELIVQLAVLPEKTNTAKYEALVEQIFYSASDRYGFIDYRGNTAAMHPILNLLYKAKEHITNGNYYEAFSIVSAVAPQCIQAIQNMDDSNGECGGAINEAFELTGKILQNTQNPGLTDTIFNWLLEQVQHADYDDYGCADNLEPVFFEWANNQERREKAYQFIDKQITKLNKGNGWSSQYNLTKYLKYKVSLLKKEGKLDEAEQIIEENIHLSDFREMRINEAIEQNKIEEAISHIKKGIEQANKDNLPGIVHKLKVKLLEIHKNAEDKIKIRELSKELFLENTGRIDYFRIYKNTFNKEEWCLPCGEIIKEIAKSKKSNYFGPIFPQDLASIYIEESMWEELFKEVKRSNSIAIVENYYKYLANDFHSEMIPLYKHAIYKYAENTGRDNYITLVKYLKNLAALKNGKSEAIKLRNELLVRYKNRRAMKEEFNKLGWD